MATGAKLIKEISDQFLICKICLEPFKEPKTLSCLHTFCCACVQEHYDTESNRPTRYTLYTRSVSCPLCRKKTELPTGGVRRLPDNFLVSNLTDVLAKRRVSKVPPCEICHTVRPRSNDACSKCLDCDKLLCRACVDLHSTTKVTQDHSLIDAEGQKDIECKAHPEETVRFYCERCEACICVVCTFQEHKDHDVCSFNDGFAKHKVTLESLLEQSRERLMGMSSRLQTIDKYEKLSKELKERIRDMAISYTSQVRAREKELIQQVDEALVGDGDLSSLALSKTWLQEGFHSLQSACNLTEIVMRDKGVEMLLLKKEIQDKMNHLLRPDLPPEPPNLQNLDIRFVPGEVKLGDVRLPGKEDEDEEEEDEDEEEVEGDGGDKVKEKKKIKKKNHHHENGMSNGVSQQREGLEIVSEKTSSSSSKINGEIGPEGDGGSNSSSSSSSCKPCKDCAERKRKEKEEEDGSRKRRSRGDLEREKKVAAAEAAGRGASRSDHNTVQTATITTTPQGTMTSLPADGGGENDEDGVGVGGGTSRTSGSGRNNKRDIIAQQQQQQQQAHKPDHVHHARGTMTERKDSRTLKVQTDESCLRDARLDSAAATGGTYPNTGAAIAAAFIRHKTTSAVAATGDAMTKSWSPAAAPAVKEMKNAEVSTDVSFGLSHFTSDAVAALCQGRDVVGGGGGGGGVKGGGGGVNSEGGGGGGGDASRPDLLAQAPSASPSSPWIKSRKVQTEISALVPEKTADTNAKSGSDKFVTDEELKESFFGSAAVPTAGRMDSAHHHPQYPTTTATTTPTSSPRLERARAVRTAASAAATAAAAAPRVTTCDAGCMTSFKVKIVPDTLDKETSSEPVTSRSLGLMTSPPVTRTVYIQTKGPRVTSTAAGTDYKGQSSKSTGTVHVTSSDAETAMPRVTHESVTTWTDALVTSERATCTVGVATSDVATLTWQVKTGDAAVQMKPIGVAAAVNTTPPRLVDHPCQTTPSVCHRGTMPDNSTLLSSSLSRSLSQDTSTSPSPARKMSGVSSSSAGSGGLFAASIQSGPLMTVPGGGGGVGGTAVVSRADKATETTQARSTTRAVGPSRQMDSFSTASTDTLHLVQVSDRETCTPAVRTVDEWTHTPQPTLVNTGVTPPRPALREVGVATNAVALMDQATYTEVVTLRENATETCTVVCDSETLTERVGYSDAQTEAEPVTESVGTSTVWGEGGGCGGGGGGGGVGGWADPEERGVADGGCCGCTTTEEGGVGMMRKKKKVSKDVESQCLSPTLLSKEMNTTRLRRKAKECQTSFSYLDCLLCQHPDKLQQLAEGGGSFSSPLDPSSKTSTNTTSSKTFTDTSTDPDPPDTHDVGTMALSCLASPLPPGIGLADTGVQTSAVSLYDKNVATSFDFDDDEEAILRCCSSRPFLGLESQDAATSTESLPYIGLLSEIDVDELIVFPEASFQLVDPEWDYEPVPMVDDETWMESLDYAEVGTQTLPAAAASGGEGGDGSNDHNTPTLIRPEDDCSKTLVSIGVNTASKVTFEKETCTPITHLFSKGTMTFYVAKMDKATSTISQTRPALGGGGRAMMGGVGGGGGREGERVVREARPRPRASVKNQDTMTSRAELRDMAVETDSAEVDGRITQCISKLRNVSQRLNSPTARKSTDVGGGSGGGSGGGGGGGEVFFPQSFQLSSNNKPKDSVSSPSSSSSSSSQPLPPQTNDKEKDVRVTCVVAPSSPSPPPQPPPLAVVKDKASADEEQRQLQLHKLLVETNAVLRSKDASPQRKAQPITTLKPRTPVTVVSAATGAEGGEVSGYASKSLPRQTSLDRNNSKGKVKMGSQPTNPTTRLPLLRYNSAPGRIATVPGKTGGAGAGGGPGQPSLPASLTSSSSPRTSPSRIPIVSQAKGVVTASGSSNGGGGSASDASYSYPSSASVSDSESSFSSTSSSSMSLSSSSQQKVQQRPSLPSISETRTPSSCSDSSFVSLESGSAAVAAAAAAAVGDVDDASSSSSFSTTLNVAQSLPPTSSPSSHSRTPSNVTMSSDGGTRARNSMAETEGSTTEGDGDNSSVGSASTLTVPPGGVEGDSSSPSLTPSPTRGKKEKKEKKGFMQRLLSGGKKKKDGSGGGGAEKEGGSGVGGGSGSSSTPVQKETLAAKQPSQPAPSPLMKSKQQHPPQQQQPGRHGGAKPKDAPKQTSGASSAAKPLPTPPVSSPPLSRQPPSSSDSSSRPSGAKGGAFVGAAAAAPLPSSPPLPARHHYPPLPDPNKTPPPIRRPQPFVIIQNRIVSIQQDNVEELKDRKEMEKERGKGAKKEEGKRSKEEKKGKEEEKKGKEEEKKEKAEKEKDHWGSAV